MPIAAPLVSGVPKRRMSSACRREIASRGRNGEPIQSTTAATMPVAHCCATKLYGPKSRNAIVTPTVPPISVASVVRIASGRKSSSRRNSASGTTTTAVMIMTGASHRMIPTSSGSSNQVAIGRAASIRQAVISTPISRLTHNDEDRCSGARSLRCTSAAVKY